MKNKFSKSIAFAIVVAMLMAMVPAVVMAEAPVISDATVAIDNVEGEKVVTVTATVTGDLSEFTLLAVRDNKAYTSISDIPSDVAAAGETMSALEKQVEYIDQPDLEGATISYQFPLRDREGDLAMTLADSYINVFLGGAGAEAVVAYEVEKLDAPAIAVEDLQEKYYTEDESLVITYTGSDEAVNLWEGKDLEVKIGDEVLTDAVWVKEADHFKVPASDFAAAAYENATITIAETADPAAFYPATVTGVTFATASRVAEAKAAIVGLKAEDVDGDETKAKITVPVDFEEAGVTISYTITTEGYTPDGDGVVTVTRPEEGQDAIKIDYKVTLTYGGAVVYEEEKSVSVSSSGVAIAEEDVQLVGNNVYGLAGNKIIIVDNAAEIDYTIDSLVVGEAKLYYVTARDYFVGVVPAATTVDDIEYVAGTASGLLYYGKAAAASNPAVAFNAVDAGGIKRMLAGLDKPDSEANIKLYLAADIGNGVMDGLINAVDFGAVKRVLAGLDKNLAINGAE